MNILLLLLLYHFALMMNNDTYCDDSVVTCEWQCSYYCMYKVYVGISLVKLV